MKSAHSEPSAYPGLTRYERDGRKWVALGEHTEAAMREAIARINPVGLKTEK